MWQMNKVCIFILVISASLFSVSAVSESYAQEMYVPLWSCNIHGEILSASVSFDGACAIVFWNTTGEFISFFDNNEISWSYKLNSNFERGGIVAEMDKPGKLVHISPNGKFIVAGGKEYVYLFDRNGNLIWKTKLNAEIKEISVSSDGYVVADCCDGTYVLDKSGRIIKSYEVGEHYFIPKHYGTFISDDHYIVTLRFDSDLIHTDTVYLYNENQLLWKTKVTSTHIIYGEGEGTLLEVISISPDSSFIAAAGSHIVVGSYKGYDLFLLDKYGNQLWDIRIPETFKDIFVYPNGSMIVATQKSILYFNKEGKMYQSFDIDPKCDIFSVSPYGNFVIGAISHSLYNSSIYLMATVKNVAYSEISKANEIVESMNRKGYRCADVKILLSKSENAFNAGNYLNAKSLAEQAKKKAREIIKLGDSAKNVIENVTNLINNMKLEGFIPVEAENLLLKSKKAFNAGNYTDAKLLAEEARKKAEEISKIATSAENAIKDLKFTLEDEKTKGFYSPKAESMLSRAEEAFKMGNYKEAKSLAENAKYFVLDIDQDGVSNEEDFAPTIKNIYIYAGAPTALLILAALTKVSLDVRRKRIKEKLERERIRREEERRRKEYEREMKKLELKLKQWKEEGYNVSELEEMLK